MHIKVVTLNIWLGGILQENFLSFLETQHADVLFLQEVHNGTDPALKPQFRTMQVLKERLGYPYEVFAPEYLDITETDGKFEVGNAILSKFPIIHNDTTDFIPYSKTYDNIDGNYHNCPYNMLHATVSTPAGEVHLFNMHGVWDMDGDNPGPLRQKMGKLVIDATKDKRPVILAGDTNARPTNPVMRDISKHLHSVFGEELQSTFNMRHKDNPGYAASAVDMMFVSDDVEVLEHECPDVDVSDHMPLVATFRIKQEFQG